MKTLQFNPDEAPANQHLINEKFDNQAYQKVLTILNEELDHRFTCLCKYPLPGLNIRIPIILVGPCGVYVMLATSVFGNFRAKEDQLLELKHKKFSLMKNNILGRSYQFAKVLKKYLDSQGINLLEVEPVLFFTDSRAQVDTARPMVRIVPEMGIRKFAQVLVNIPRNLPDDTVFKVISAVTNLPVAAMERVHNKEQAAPDPKAPQIIQKSQKSQTQKITPFQWLILTFLGALLLILIAVFYAVVVLGI